MIRAGLTEDAAGVQHQEPQQPELSRGRGDRACPPQRRPDAFQHPSGRQSRYPGGARKADRGEAPGSFGMKIDEVRSQTRSVAGTP